MKTYRFPSVVVYETRRRKRMLQGDETVTGGYSGEAYVHGSDVGMDDPIIATDTSVADFSINVSDAASMA